MNVSKFMCEMNVLLGSRRCRMLLCMMMKSQAKKQTQSTFHPQGSKVPGCLLAATSLKNPTSANGEETSELRVEGNNVNYTRVKKQKEILLLITFHLFVFSISF